jgi:hypothetical protein
MRQQCKKYNVVTGLTIVNAYRTNSYFKAIVAMIYRRIFYGRGWITKSY